MSTELEESYKLADGEATYLLSNPPANKSQVFQLIMMLSKALVIMAREARRLSLYKVMFDQMALAADCKCDNFAECQHLMDAFSVFEATKMEMERIALARTEKPKKTLRDILTEKPKPDLKAPLIESVINPETIH